MKYGKKVLSFLLSTAMVLGMSVPALAGTMDGKLVIIHTNDMHGYYQTGEKCIGIAGVKGLKDYYTAQGADVILLDAGDFSQGTTLVNYSKGLKAAEYLVSADYDAASLGNHEFDFGFDSLLDMVAVLKAGNVPVIDANILKKGTNQPYFDASIVLEKGGMKIGVFGLDTAETQTKSSPSSVKDVTFLDGEAMYEKAQAEVDALKAKGCDYIVALVHLGVDDESVGRRSTDVAKAVKGIDLMIDGHSHTVMDGGEKVNDTLIVSTGSYLENVGTVVIEESSKAATAKLISAADYATSIGKYDEALTKMVAADKAEVDAYYAGLFAKTEVDLNGEREPGVRTEETNLGDFAADAFLYVGKKYAQEQNLGISVDVALSNGGGIRASIPTGDISMNTLYTVFPYGNTVALVTVTGQQLLEVLEASTFATPTALGGFPQIAGAEFTVNTAMEYKNGAQYPDSTYYAPAAPGSRVTITSVGGKAFDLKAKYTVVVNSFQAEGGDTYYALTQGSFKQDTGIIDAEALIQYVDSMKGVIGKEYAKPQGRINIVSEPVAAPAVPEVAPAPEATPAPEVVKEPVKVPETAPKTEPVQVATDVYKVVKGDSLWKIAKELLGDGNQWKTIYENNKDQIKDPAMIYVGQELIIKK
ncbi:trifunctional nucleotide phosphoesterase protein YfkN precursor [Anaerotignum neopropionicum]|uniref:Trifunctional nucleotide phosphoesterase protein YfkN n=1 Tax=Anaerotignum neopropionicum TaxID=36847 RepID=A0A136WB94_9FIRM|nr:5'-nucleotidase C-terminal domain-containing protein [Anaerotignum neopropionicum]KXL51781.1 trifunctional nucleotide phosphoesterase protein YfkN precursor [Anaerotignum neopropionicum]